MTCIYFMFQGVLGVGKPGILPAIVKVSVCTTTNVCNHFLFFIINTILMIAVAQLDLPPPPPPPPQPPELKKSAIIEATVDTVTRGMATVAVENVIT